MASYRILIRPESAFGSRLMGDTLFGQLCWMARHRFGEDRLTELLRGYTDQQPFAVVSDAFPAGHLPRPAWPSHRFDAVPNQDRKTVKKRVWLPLERFAEPFQAWLTHCKAPADVQGGALLIHPQPHNTIDRLTGTTGDAAFAPYAMSQHWFDGSASLDIYVVLDEAKLRREELALLFDDMGAIGYGRDASIGLGKFRVAALEPWEPPRQAAANAYLTLAPCAPQGGGFEAGRSFYQVFTRFGRHGDIGVHAGNPFKSPVLLAQTGAVLTPQGFEARAFVGRGLGGDGSLSKSIPATVQQGYAPVVGIRLPAPESAP